MNDDGNTSYVAAEDVFCDAQGMRSLKTAAFSLKCDSIFVCGGFMRRLEVDRFGGRTRLLQRQQELQVLIAVHFALFGSLVSSWSLQAPLRTLWDRKLICTQ